MSDSQNEINKIKAKTIYNELIVKYNNIKNAANEENIIKKLLNLILMKIKQKTIMMLKGYIMNQKMIMEYQDLLMKMLLKIKLEN